MTQRPGLVVATVFALGAFLGLASSLVFLGIEESAIRSTAETHVAALPVPIAEKVLGGIEERDVFGRVADDVRADQVRNLRFAGVIAGLVAVGLGVIVGRRSSAAAAIDAADTADRPAMERQV